LSQLMRLRHNPLYAYVEQRVSGEIDSMFQAHKARGPFNGDLRRWTREKQRH
jgi:hypothetical protein